MSKNPLKAWRDDRELPQEALAKLIGVKPMTVSRWERGSHLPNKKHWQQIEKVTGVSASELIPHVKREAA